MEVSVLGPVEVAIDGVPVRLAKRQHRLIVGILGIEANHGVSSGRLIDLLWGDRPPARPQAVLHSRLSELRAVLRAAGGTAAHRTITTDDDGYTLRVPARMVDAHRFWELISDSRKIDSDPQLREVLRRALDLWRGPVLGGCSPAGPIGALLRSLESARLTAAEDLYEAELRLGNHGIIADELMALSATHPTRDRLTAAVMLALLQRVEGAVERRHVRHIAVDQEVGAEPGGERPHPFFQRLALVGESKLGALVAERLGFSLRLVEHLIQLARDRGLSVCLLRVPIDLALHALTDRGDAGSRLLQDRDDDALVLLEQGRQQMEIVYLRIAVASRERDRVVERFAGFDGETIGIDHVISLYLGALNLAFKLASLARPCHSPAVACSRACRSTRGRE